jgi:hypothetical protein
VICGCGEQPEPVVIKSINGVRYLIRTGHVASGLITLDLIEHTGTFGMRNRCATFLAGDTHYTPVFVGAEAFATALAVADASARRGQQSWFVSGGTMPTPTQFPVPCPPPYFIISGVQKTQGVKPQGSPPPPTTPRTSSREESIGGLQGQWQVTAIDGVAIRRDTAFSFEATRPALVGAVVRAHRAILCRYRIEDQV